MLDPAARSTACTILRAEGPASREVPARPRNWAIRHAAMLAAMLKNTAGNGYPDGYEDQAAEELAGHPPTFRSVDQSARRSVCRSPYPLVSVLLGVRYGCRSPVRSGQFMRTVRDPYPRQRYRPGGGATTSTEAGSKRIWGEPKRKCHHAMSSVCAPQPSP